MGVEGGVWCGFVGRGIEGLGKSFVSVKLLRIDCLFYIGFGYILRLLGVFFGR